MRNPDPFADLIRSIEENLAREGSPNPPRPPLRPPLQGNWRRWLWLLIPLLLLLFFNRILSFYADWFWYDSLDLTTVFLTRLWASLGLFVVGALVAWLFLVANVLLVRRLEPAGLTGTPAGQQALALGVRITLMIFLAGALFAALMGFSLAARWEDLLLYLNQHPFGLADPLFGRDLSFFLFSLPVWQTIRLWLMMVLVVSGIAVALAAGIGWRSWLVRTPVLAHLAVLAALVLGLIAWGYRLNAYQLLYSQRGALFGAGYTDIHANLPAYNLLSGVTLVAALLLLLLALLRRRWQAFAAVLVVWMALSHVAGTFYPGLVQRFRVSPNELALERPYLAHHIQFTRAAFDLANIERQAYPSDQLLTAESVLNAPGTVTNLPLWDFRPLLTTFNQLQALTQYYAFHDVDIDRYLIDGQRYQVMLSARELVPERLNPEAQTWVNRRLVYTHGYGVVVSPISQVTPDGLPTFLLKDLPPQGVLRLSQPQIYFGELTNDPVIARTAQPEFDYSEGERVVTTRFEANSGIRMSWGARLLFALYFADINLLLNRDLHADSQLLWRRNISERVQEIAPFLHYAADPYIVVSEDGRLYWFQDAFVTSNRFPYSQPVASAGGLNYIRNSVKVITNAYDGSVHFYVVDDQEPITAAYRAIFPTLFTPFSAMPADLQRHIRYPNDLFSIQADVYRLYHMTNPEEFYNREDVWAWPEELFDDETVPMRPYYVLMTLPGSSELDFIQILPFTPANRENMIAWLAVHNDPDKYGQKLVYAFGKDTLFYGPKQIEARISQDAAISAQLSLWNQAGTRVIRGNLLVIPMGDSLLYVEPLYLQAVTGRIPELRRVILATGDRVVMAENLGQALAELVGRDVLADSNLAALTAAAPAPPATGAAGAATPSVGELITRANAQFTNAQTNMQNGNWTGYAQEIAALEATLLELAQLAGIPLTSTLPAGEAAPLDGP